MVYQVLNLYLIMVQVDRRYNLNTEFIWRLSAHNRQIHGMSTRRGTTNARRLPPARRDRRDVRGDDVTRHCPTVGHLCTNEEWSDHLYVTMVIQKRPEIAMGRENVTTSRTWVWVRIGKKKY